jgi:hypothetical protein
MILPHNLVGFPIGAELWPRHDPHCNPVARLPTVDYLKNKAKEGSERDFNQLLDSL